jgi:hypothetical protein
LIFPHKKAAEIVQPQSVFQTGGEKRFLENSKFIDLPAAFCRRAI